MMRLLPCLNLAQTTDQTTSPDTLDWLLGLSRIHWRDAGTELAWRYPLPLWLWVILLLACFALAAWSYSRLLGPRPARAALAITRTLLLLFMLALLAGPLLVLPQERVEPDWLLVLIDRSASLHLPTPPAPGTPGISSGRPAETASAPKPLTRDQALNNALIAQKEAFSQSRMGKDRRILWLGFDRTAYPITSPDTGQPMPAAQGDGTLLRTAIEQGLERLSGRPIAGVVLMTDGRSPESTAGEFPQRLKQQAVSIFPVPLGSEIAGLSLQVARVDAPDRAFIKDQVPVNVWIEHSPPQAPLDLSKVVVTLTDTTTGKRLDTQRPRAGASQNEPIALRARSMVPGSTTWRVDVTQDNDPAAADPATTQSAPSAPPENNLLGDNNQASVSIEFVDRPLRVLYVEGYPRWEYRYLKNLLVREKSVQASVLLLSADQGFAQEGEESLTRLPSTAKELEPFDVILIGDVPSSYFGSAQMDLIRDQVATRGSGLLWIGGALNTPRSYESTSLSELLPMSRPGSVEPFDLPALPLSMRPSELAARSGVLRLDPALDQGPAQAQAFWNTTLPALWWVQRLGPLKPGAETLAFGAAGESSASDAAGVSTVNSAGASIGNSGGPGVALVTRLRFGAGQSVYVATDDTWRWRRGRGDVYFDRFWIQLLRMVGRGRLSQRDQRVSLELSRRRVEVDQAVVVTVRVDDTQLAARELSRVAVNVQRASASSATQPASANSSASNTIERLELLPVGPAGNAARNGAPAGPASVSSASSPRVFQALWRPSLSGSMVVSIAEPALADVPISAAITVLSPDDELRQTATDHARLAALATDTGGKVVALDKLDELASVVPHRAKRTPTDVRESLWDSPLALGLLTLLLTLEWVGRKLIRLT
jgi:hypothetical protein